MTFPYPDGDPLEGLDPTPSERLAFYRALDETEAEEAGLPYDAWGEDPDPGEDDLLQQAGDAHAAALGLDAQRVTEDITDSLARRPSSYDRWAGAMRRVGAGTYTPPPQLRGDPAAAAAARDPLGRYQAACGPLDPLGRCGARFHDHSCHAATESAAAAGSYESAEAWNATLRGQPSAVDVAAAAAQLSGPAAAALELAAPGGDYLGWDELLEPPGEPGGGDPAVRARMLAWMGERDAAAGPPREGPDVSGLIEELGLR